MDVTKVGLIAANQTEAVITSPIESEEKFIYTEAGANSKICGTSGKAKTNLDEKFKVEGASLGELLGSVTTHNCPGVRASARVIQKMKQDSIRPITPPPNEKEIKVKEDKSIQKTPSQAKSSNKATWTNIERNYFFDALNEFGKDCDAIGNFINSKLKRKSSTDAAFKTKDQVRLHYFHTYHKIYKYIPFSDEVKKPVQELYTLINYGEMRRKLPFVTEKHFIKLKDLVYNGHTTVKCKGKNIRIKTPICKALRRLNQLDDSLEDIKLPNKIEVFVYPANMESFGKVQILAQNPKAKATVSLQKKLVNFIKTFQHKWRSNEVKLAEEEQKMFPTHSAIEAEQVAFHDAQMCFRPRPGVPIHRPLLKITKYLSSLSLCLSAYEDRIGVKVRSETLCQDQLFSSKRQRCDSGSDKRSPDNKKFKPCELLNDGGFSISEDISTTFAQQQANESENSNQDGDLSDELNDMMSFTEIKNYSLSDITSDNDLRNHETHQQSYLHENGNSSNNMNSSDPKDQSAASSTELKSKTARRRRAEHKKTDNNFKALISDDVIKKIRKGWTTINADDITIGDLYVVFGQDSKLELEYFWTDSNARKQSIFNQKQNGMPYSINDFEEPELVNTLTKSTLGNKLKHLLLIANLSERIRKKQCSCGHTCDKPVKPKIDREIVTKSFVSSKTFQLSTVDSGVFRQPVVPFRRPTFSLDPIKQMPNGSRLKMSKQVLVQRLLLPHRSGQPYDVVDVNDLQNKLVNKNESPSVSNGNSKLSPDSSSMSTSASSELEPPAEPADDLHVESVASLDQTDSITPSSVDTSSHTTSSTNDQSPNETDAFLNEPAADSIQFDESSTSSIFKGIPPMSPTNLLRDSSSNSRWLEENLNDFSLNSLLGHLDEINGNRDITDQSSILSVLSESSVDYMTKFAEITASMQNEEKDL